MSTNNHLSHDSGAKTSAFTSPQRMSPNIERFTSSFNLPPTALVALKTHINKNTLPKWIKARVQNRNANFSGFNNNTEPAPEDVGLST